MDNAFVEVVFNLPIDKVFFYSLPSPLKSLAAVGKRVIAPFGRRRIVGYIVGLRGRVDVEGIKDILDIIDDEPIFDKKRLSLYRWLSSYYFSPLGEVIKTAHTIESQPREERLFYLTPEGIASMQKKDANTLSRQILFFIHKKGRVSINTICRSFKGRAIYAALSSLKKKGLVEEKAVIKDGSRVQKKGFVTCTEKGKSEIRNPKSKIHRRAPKQAAILKRVMSEGEVSLDELRDESPQLHTPLRGLKNKGMIKIVYREVLEPWMDESLPTHKAKLNPEQKQAVNTMKEALSKGNKTFLLYGVTGSGKTEVYLRVMEEVVKMGKRVLFLAPEIALAGRLSRYILSRFKRVALLHSGLTKRERFKSWAAIKNGEIDVVAGARSAVFAPMKDIGLIIVDEEHDPSYKQEEGFRYNARDVALLLGSFYNCAVLLGSATPSIESYYRSIEGKLVRLELLSRVEERTLPYVTTVDMRKEKANFLSSRLLEAVGKRLEEGEQTILFLNRKGYSPFILCKDCGHVYKCPNCLISLTFYKIKRCIRCHYCGYTVDAPETCEVCHGHRLYPIGAGIEKVIEEIERQFPGVKIGRMDREVVRRGERVWDAFDKGELNILIGTQIVTKGYHFPNVTLVGVILGDQSLNLPDFRATERQFQLLMQVAGRAGRGDKKGEVIIQTYNPEGSCFEKLLNHDYEGFFRDELKFREEAGYPPFARLVNIIWEGEDEEDVSAEALYFRKRIAGLKGAKETIEVLGPTPAFYARLRGRYRWQFVIKGKDAKGINTFLRCALDGYKPKKGVRFSVDVDPARML